MSHNVAFVASDADLDGHHTVRAYVSSGPPEHHVLDEMDATAEASVALGWARERASVVLFRLAVGSAYYSVGETAAPSRYGAAPWQGTDQGFLAAVEAAAGEAAAEHRRAVDEALREVD